MSQELPHRITKIYKWVNLLEPWKSLNLVDLVKIETELRCGRYEQRLRWFAVIKFGEEYTGKKATGISSKCISEMKKVRLITDVSNLPVKKSQ